MRTTATFPIYQSWDVPHTEDTATASIKKIISKHHVGYVLLAVLVFIAGYILFQLWGSWACAHDACIQSKIDGMRTEKEAYQAKIQSINTSINDLKKNFSSGYVIEQIQTQHLQNVHPDILSRAELIPASSGAGMSAPTGAERQQLATYLKTKQSPFAQENILQSCANAQVNRSQCYMLIAISGAESSFGTQYRKLDTATGRIVVANQEGQKKYNPVGIKGGGVSYPTADGFYIRQFQSWTDFWQQYPRIMKQGYFDRGGSTLAIISKCYVSGDCQQVKAGWTQRSEQFYREIVAALAKETTYDA